MKSSVSPCPLYRLFLALKDLVKREIAYGVLPPIPVIEVPALRLVYGKPFFLHGAAQQIAVIALQGCAAEIIRIRAIRHFVITADHLDRLTGLAVVQRQIDGAATIVPR